MWMMVLRPLVFAFGVLSTGSAAIVAMVEPSNPYSDTLMYFVFVMMAAQGVVGIGCIVAAIWGPMSRWLGHRAH